MSVPLAIVECDLDDDGVFETDISAYTRSLTTSFGRRSILEKHRPRTLSNLLLDNEDSRFSPDNASSPYNQGGLSWKQDQRIRVKVQVPTAAVTNLCENPSLETDLVGWSGQSALTRETTKARFGRACCSMPGAATISWINVRNRDSSMIAVSASTAYVWRVWVRGEGSANFAWKLRLSWYTAGDAWISDSVGATFILSPGGPWERIVVVATSPPTAAKVDCWLLEAAGFGVGDTIYVDGTDFYAGTDVNLPYCDGDVPGSTWSGTAHESTSSRPADPTFTKFQGRITSINLSRGQGGDPPCCCAVEAVSNLDRLLDREISIGTMRERAGDIVINAILDRIEDGEVIESRGGEWLDKWPQVSDWTTFGGSSPHVDDQLVDDLAIEADYYRYFYEDAAYIYANSGCQLDVSSYMGAGETWKVTMFLLNPLETGGYGGKDVTVYLMDSGGTLEQETVALPNVVGETVYVSQTVTWTPAGTGRKIRILHDENAPGIYVGFGWDILHAIPEMHILQRDLRFGSGETQYVDLEHVAAFYRSARSLLDDVISSLGGILWERGDGTFVVEDYKVRLDAPIPIVRFTDAAGELDGAGIPPTTYARGEDRTYSRVTAISDGDLSAAEIVTEPVWSLEPAGITLAADEEKRFYARYLSDASGPLIVDRATLRTNVKAGSLSADSGVINMGVGGIVRIIAGGSGATVESVHITGRVRQRSSQRGRTSKGDDTGRELEIDMACQAENTTAMNEVAQQLLDLLSSGRQTMTLPLQAGTPLEWLYAAGLEISDPIWLRHNTGPGNYALNEAYYVEGGRLMMVAGSLLELEMYADKAS